MGIWVLPIPVVLGGAVLAGKKTTDILEIGSDEDLL